MSTIEPKKEEKKKDKKKNSHVLLIHNDEVNTFDWVIESLVQICKHTPEQAEQCAMIAHNKGKCDVKEGEKETLIQMKRELNNRHIEATVEN